MAQGRFQVGRKYRDMGQGDWQSKPFPQSVQALQRGAVATLRGHLPPRGLVGFASRRLSGVVLREPHFERDLPFIHVA
eukprot:9485107-Pyramimonas_sp.AAC.1